MKNLKILMIGWEYPPNISGGLGVACHGMVQALARAGHLIYFLIPHLTGDEPSMENVHLIDIANGSMFLEEEDLLALATLEVYQEVKSSPFRAYQTQMSNIENHKNLPFEDFQDENQQLSFPVLTGGYKHNLLLQVEAFGKWVARVSKKIDFDLIHAHDWMSFKGARVASEISGRPFLTHIHTTEIDRNPGIPNQDIYDIELEGMQKANSVIAVSHFTSTTIHLNYQIPENKIQVVHNGIDHNLIPKFEDLKLEEKYTKNVHHTVLFLGRITAQKGPEHFINAAALVLQKMPQTKFIMAGLGDLLDAMKIKTKQSGIDNNFSFPGFLERKDVHSMYEKSNLLVMPSVSEPFGITALEAMSFGLPVIIAKNSGVCEKIKNCIQVNPADSGEIASNIVRLLKDKNLQIQTGSKGAAEVKKLTWENQSREIEKIYSDLCSDC